MYQQGYITETAVRGRDPRRRCPPRATSSRPTLESKAPYFTSWMRQQLVDRYGAAKAFFGGLKVKSTLDLRLQAAAEEAVNSYLGYLPATASVVVLDNHNAGVKAMVGGPELRHQALQPGDPRPPPAGILDQALHADHRPRRGDLALHGLRIGAADLLLRQARQGNLRRPQRRGLLPRLLRHRLRDHLLRQLDLRPARARRAEGQDDPRPHGLDRGDDPQDGLQRRRSRPTRRWCSAGSRKASRRCAGPTPT